MAKAKKRNFPETIHVVEDPNGGEMDFIASTTVEDAIDGDGPTAVADYKLVRVRKFRKDAVEAK